MAKVITTLLHGTAPVTVNGFLFTPDRGQFISQDLPDADAAYFASIPGYKLITPPPVDDQADKADKAPKTPTAK